MGTIIYIIGAGSIGRALAVVLKQAGKDVILVRGSVDGLTAAPEQVTLSMADGKDVTETIVVKTMSELQKMDGIVVITAKSYANDELAGKLALKGTRCHPVVLLQNGLNVERPFMERGFLQLYRCVLFVTAQFTAENRVRFKPVAACPVGLIRGDMAQLKETVRYLDTLWFSFMPEPAIHAVIWQKVTVNCVFNSVCPLLDTDNGIFHRDGSALTIARRVIGECILVARLCGVHLQQAATVEMLLAISKASDGQLISTLQDIRQKRPTEIATLNLEIVRIAEQFERGDLVMETRLLGELTAAKSSLNLIP